MVMTDGKEGMGGRRSIQSLRKRGEGKGYSVITRAEGEGGGGRVYKGGCQGGTGGGGWGGGMDG